MAEPSLAVHTELLASFLNKDGLSSNGSVTVHMQPEPTEGAGAHACGTPELSEASYELKSIAWRLLEDIGVGIAAYNTPKNLNSLSPNQQMETFLVLEHAKRDPRVKAVVWTATGTRAFCSGASLKGDMNIHVPGEIQEAYFARGLAPIRGEFVLSNHTRAFWDFPKPLVMAINGLAVGGGANIALANFGDVIIGSTNARFMYPFAKLGITPELGSSLMLPWLIGMAKAKELMMTGSWVDAKEALRLNLMTQVCEPSELLPRAVETASSIVANSTPSTLRLMKQVMNAPLREQLDAILIREEQVIQEAVRASGGFLKRAKL